MLSKPLCSGLGRGVHCLIPAGTSPSRNFDLKRFGHTLPASYVKVNKWNRAVSEAEKLVGYPTSLMSLRALMSDDLTNMAVHFRKLIGTDHPVLKTVKRLLYHGKNNMQVRGLLVLLLSRAAGSNGISDIDTNTGVLNDQRKLAEILEMIYTSQCIHQSVVNVPVNIAAEPDEQIRAVLQQLEYGNKIAILSGDYLLANACTGLAGLRIPKIVELVAQAIVEFTQAEFLGKQDPQGKLIPTPETILQECWEEKWKLGAGGLLGAGCECAMMVAKQPEELLKASKDLGVHTALAIQAYDEMKLFSVDGGIGSGAPFPLCSAPVMFHLQTDSELLDYLQQFTVDVMQVDYRRVLTRVCEGDGLEKTQELCKQHVDKSLESLRKFPENEGRQAYENLLLSMV